MTHHLPKISKHNVIPKLLNVCTCTLCRRIEVRRRRIEAKQRNLIERGKKNE
jgi:hypothetical protein